MKIGISFCLTNFEKYWDWFDMDSIERIELSYKKNNTDDFANCDGFVLTGGVDINCALYNEPDKRLRQEDFNKERDIFESKIFAYAQAHNKPLLAICRGLQL